MSKIEVGGQEINGIVHLTNGFSTNAKKMVYEKQEIKDRLPMLEHKYVKTSEDRSETIGELQSVVEPDDMVVIYGGEAAVNVAAEAYIKGMFSEYKIPHLVRPGGNKNDLYHTLYKTEPRSPLAALTDTKSELIAINPLEFYTQSQFDSSPEDLIINEFALSYGGLGAIAEACKLLNQRRQSLVYRGIRKFAPSRFAIESLSTLQGLLTAKQFSLIDHKQDDMEFSLVERSYINGGRLAGGLIHTLIEADDNWAVRIEERNRLDLMMELGGQAISSSGATYVEKIDEDFTLTSPAMLHLDAEHRRLRKNTRVQIKRSSKPFYVLSNR